MNPCNCGYYPNMSKCRCSPAVIQKHMNKLSQPLLDRIDLCVEVSAVGYDDLTHREVKNESSAQIRNRVIHGHEIQKERFQGSGILFNSGIPAKDLQHFCPLGDKEMKYMEEMYKKMDLTARTYHKIVRVARTIADMDGEEMISRRHLQEALCYRSIDRRYWENCL